MNLKNHISQIISEFSYKVRSKKHPDACICYQQNKPCHKMDDLNCFLCYCPFYDTSKEEGGCKRNCKDGKWFYSEKLPKGKIWDCSDCTYPHEKATVKGILEEFFNNK